ncbi:MAG: PAS domain S-box protein [Bacteroidetes bacterium]|nr:PAS domain S-box protein [Bacteroidota bacterium]
MSYEKDLINIVQNNIQDPAFILDYDGFIYDLNSAAKNYFPNAQKDRTFYELFKPQISDKLKELFDKTKTSKETVKGNFNLFETGVQKEMEFFFSSVEIHYDQKFLITVKVIEKIVEPWKINKIEIFTSEITRLVKDRKVIEIIEKIKSSFPFSFIGKSKIQKDIDSLEHYFWIKDLNRKYLLSNNSFAKWLGLKIENIEGKREEDYLPPYLNNLFETIDRYILDTANVVVFEGILNFTKDDQTTEIVALPIYDAEQNVVAICGVTQDTSSRTSNITEHFSFYENTIQNFSEPIVIADKENKILSASKTVNEMLGLDEKADIKTATIDRIFGEGLLTKITNTLTDPDYNKKIIFEVKEGKRPGNFDVLIHKILNSRNQLSGYYLYFNNKYEGESSTSVKVKMYDIIMQTSPEAIFIYDIDNLKFLEVNDSALKLYGYNREEFLQMDLTDLYAPEDIQTLLDSSNIIGTDNQFSGPWRHKKRDSSSLLVLLSKTGLNYNGKRAHLNIVKNVTDKLENEKQLQLLKASFENSSDMILYTDVDGFITFANKPAINILGYSKKDFEKKPFLSILADNDRAKVNKEIFHSDSKTKKQLKIDLKKLNGEILKVEAVASPIVDYKGEIDSFCISIKVEKSVEVIRNVQESGSGSTGLDSSFLSQLFHELLTPINVIIGFAGELTENADSSPEELREAADIIKENQKQLMQTMDNAVEYSNVEQNLVTVRTEDINFIDIIEEIEDGVKKTLESFEVELSYGKISSSLAFINDRQKFMTLLIQFLKFTIQATKERKIYLSAYQYEDNNFIISVKDSVGGISAALNNSLNEIFSGDETAVHHKFGVSRFTLRLVRRLLEILNARIELVNKSGTVSEYGILFPLELKGGHKVEPKQPKPSEKKSKKDSLPKVSFVNQEDEKPVFIEEREHVRQTKSQPKHEPVAVSAESVMEGAINLNELSCLYVEDQVDSQILFKVQMKDLKSIDFATSFEKAMPLLQKNIYDFIVLDINLQGEYNGLDALRVIQKMPQFKKTPIYAVTAYALPGDQDRFKTAGFTDFVSKPILREKLVEVLNHSF